MARWLIKSEPSVYSYDQLVDEGRTAWTGIRNFEARNNLRAMAPGDRCLFYHSGEDKAVVGVARVLGKPYPDPTAKGEDWSCVDVAPEKKLKAPVTLAAIKAKPALKNMQLLKRGRLSVTPVTDRDFELVVSLGSPKAR